MTRDEKVARMRGWLQTVPHVQPMIAKAMMRNGVTSVMELAEKHPKQFNSLYAAIETMEEEMPEPKMPWPMS
jgi:hypothetical protein